MGQERHPRTREHRLGGGQGERPQPAPLPSDEDDRFGDREIHGLGTPRQELGAIAPAARAYVSRWIWAELLQLKSLDRSCAAWDSEARRSGSCSRRVRFRAMQSASGSVYAAASPPTS